MAAAIPLDGGDGPFTVEDFDDLTARVLAAWRSGVDLDWTVPAGTLEWSCWTTADLVEGLVAVTTMLSAVITGADPMAEVCRRLLAHTSEWPFVPTVSPTDDPWSDLLERSGRARGSLR